MTNKQWVEAQADPNPEPIYPCDGCPFLFGGDDPDCGIWPHWLMVDDKAIDHILAGDIPVWGFDVRAGMQSIPLPC